jgi:DUF4097 and DUF4098 domain-containing protein YvlB
VSEATGYPRPAGPVRVTTKSGAVLVVGEDRGDVLVRGAPARPVDGGGLEVGGRSGAVEVRVPSGTDVIVGAGSGRVELRGRLGDARVTTGSGSIGAEHCARLDARTGSGSLSVGICEGPCRLHTGSGSVRVGRAGDADVVTGSGTVVAEHVDGARVKTGSGSVTLGLERAGDVKVHAHSGSVTVTVPPGLRPRTRLTARSGSVRCDCEPGEDGEIDVVTGSGGIVVEQR